VSKYLSKANEKINSENIEIRIEGISVNNEKNNIYKTALEIALKKLLK